MPLQSGSRLGPFEILSRLGAGGMGEVWRARDTRLQRDVALKVLPDAFAQDPDRLARFTREAHVLASLNHPNIAAIYSFEEIGAIRVLVLELVTGETLKQRILRGPVGVNESLALAIQIADALEAAHATGILHRDLKPANVCVTPGGKVKLLDFGLAKAFALGSSSPDISHSPTAVADHDATRQGVVLGTASYMSPEQARSRPLDARSDLWAFGCLLYETLTGRKAFDGESVSDILVAILDREPAWDALPSGTPAPLRDLLKRLLQKDPNDRPADVRAARALLEAAAGSRTTAVFSALTPAGSRARLGGLAALLAVLGVGGYVALRTRTGAGALPKDKYLAILPFKDLSGRPEGQIIVDGLAESFEARLTKVPDLMVMASGRDHSGASDAEIARFARERGANLLLQCAYRSQGNAVRLTYRLISPSSLAILAGDEVEGLASDQFALEDRLFGEVLAALRVHVGKTGAPAAASAAAVAQRPAAGEPYFRALGLLQRFDDASLKKAIEILDTLPGGERSALVQAALARALLERFRLAKDPSDAARARAAVERALALDDRLPESHLASGQLLLLTGKPAEAVTEIRKALERQARSADATLTLGDALSRAGARAEAEAAYREAIAMNPEYWAGYSRLAALYYQRGDMANALDLFRTSAEKNPTSPRIASNVGATLLRLGRLDEAQAAFRRAVDLAPDANAWSNLGTSQYLAGLFTDAAASFEKAVDLAPHEMRYRINLGDAYAFAPGLADKAPSAYAKGLELATAEARVHPLAATDLTVAAKAEVKTGHAARGAQTLRQALALEPDNPTVLFRAAIVENALGHPAEAVRLLTKAVAKGFAPAQIARDPELATLRDDPGFRSLVAPAPAAPEKARTP